MTLKDIVLQVLENAVFPVLDAKAKEWKTPFEIDDRVWESVKARIRSRLAPAIIAEMAGGYFLALPGINVGAFDIKGLIKSFIVTVVFREVDDFTKSWKTPFEVDDKAWAWLKEKISQVLDQIDVKQDVDGVTTYELVYNDPPASLAC